MKTIFKFIQTTWWLFLILFLAPIVVIAIFAIMEFYLQCIDMPAGDWAGLWGSAFSYWGTVILGTLAFWQNNQVQENNDLLMNYERNKMAPVFCIILEGYQGMLQNLKFVLVNCSDNIACNLEVSDMEIYRIDNHGSDQFISRIPIFKTEKINILGAHSEVHIEYNNKTIIKKEGEQIILKLKISASDIIGLKRITVAKITISDGLEPKYEYIIEKVV